MKKYGFVRFKRTPRSSVSAVQQSNAYSVREVIQGLVRDGEFLATQAKMGTFDCCQTPEQAADGLRPQADLDAPRARSVLSRKDFDLRGLDAMYPPGVAEQIRVAKAKTVVQNISPSEPPTPAPSPAPTE